MNNNKLLLNYNINRKSLKNILNDSLLAITNKSKLVFACANPHSLAIANADSDFKTALNNADLLVSDGVGIVAVAKFLNIDVGPRITGDDYLHGLNSLLNQKGLEQLGRKPRIFFFGSNETVLQLIKNNMEKYYPQLELCGVLSPPYGLWSDEMNKEMIEKINATKPDVLWVGMTAPRQEKWIDKNSHLLDVSIMGAIGAVFDFFAGTYERAPAWVAKIGMEWLYRILKEPRRMWQRTVISLPKFFLLVIRYHVI